MAKGRKHAEQVDLKLNCPVRDGYIRDDLRFLAEFFEGLVAYIKDNYEPYELCKIVLTSPLVHKAIFCPLKRIEHLHSADITDHISNIIQSSEELLMTDLEHITIGIVTPLQIRGTRRIISTARNMFGHNFLKLKKSCVIIANTDGLCLPRAIVVSWAAANKFPASSNTFKTARRRVANSGKTAANLALDCGCVSQTAYNNIVKPRAVYQTNLAVELCRRAGIDLAQKITIDMLTLFEDALVCNIRIVSQKAGDRLLASNVRYPHAKTLYVYLTDNDGSQPAHADSIVYASGFLHPKDLCTDCHKSHPRADACIDRCSICLEPDCSSKDDGDNVMCADCNAPCNDLDCLARHKMTARERGETRSMNRGLNQRSMCSRFWHCQLCKAVIKRCGDTSPVHTCYEKRCGICNVRYATRGRTAGEHKCYMRNTTVGKKVTKMLFYDIETTQTTTYQCKHGHLPDEDAGPNAICTNCLDARCGSLRHVAVLIVCHSTCEQCRNDVPLSKCRQCGTRCDNCSAWTKNRKAYANEDFCADISCGRRQVYFEGIDAAERFTTWLFATQHSGYTAIAHNGSGFDVHIIYEQMILNGVKPCKIIYNGSKILYCEVSQPITMRFIDSLCFMPMALSRLPDAFDLKELSKGFFPYLFVRPDNLDYIGPIPDRKFFAPESMSIAKHTEFTAWYDEQIVSTAAYVLREEMLKYCISDVNILREACLVFQTLMIDVTGCDPFQAFSIAGVAMRVYRSMFAREHYKVLTPDGIHLDARKIGCQPIEVCVDGRWVSEESYGGFDSCTVKFAYADMALSNPSGIAGSNINHSATSIAWLEWESHKRGISIRHARNGGEVKLPKGQFVDGLHGASATVFDYRGCVIHGHKCLTSNRDRVIFGGKTANQRARSTARTTEAIRDQGYGVVIMYECEWLVLSQSPDTAAFVNALDVPKRLTVRNAFFGGRTELFWMYRQVTDEGAEKIRYLDVCSLYPSRQKFERFPLGHPTVVIAPETCDIDQYFGYAHVKVLAPRALHIPVLPLRVGGKLLFPLCRSCAASHSEELCTCTDAERSWAGTYATAELSYAVGHHGYTILDIYEVYHWPKTCQYNKDGTDDGLFAQYVNTFLRIKQQASGYPVDVVTQSEKDSYIAGYEKHEGIVLDAGKIEKRAALRSIAKMCLNALWGKLSQRPMPLTEVFGPDDEARVVRLMADPSREVVDFFIPADNMLVMKSKNLYESATPIAQGRNLYVAALVTAYGRIHLHKIMTAIGHQHILYCDTDSVIYVQQPDSYVPPVGRYLGDLTDELEDGDFITEFCSNLPKSYAYRTHQGRSIVKVKGFTLNYANSQRITIDTLAALVRNSSISLSTEIQNKIVRHREASVLLTIPQGKRFRTRYDKRVVQDGYDTLPFGY